MLDATATGHGPDLAAFDWKEPFRLSDQLTDDERMIAEAARAYAQDKLHPRVTDMFLNEGVAPEIFVEMGEMGLLGVTIPEAYGGLSGSYLT